jgi:hypothetical protein
MLKEIVLEGVPPKKIKTVDPLTGGKKIRLLCKPHFKLDKSGPKPTCVKMGQDEIAQKKKAIKKALLTKKQHKDQIKKQADKKRKKTLRLKKAIGL